MAATCSTCSAIFQPSRIHGTRTPTARCGTRSSASGPRRPSTWVSTSGRSMRTSCSTLPRLAPTSSPGPAELPTGASESTSTARSSVSPMSLRPPTSSLRSPTHSSRPANPFPDTSGSPADPVRPGSAGPGAIHHGGLHQMSSQRLKIYTTTSCGDCRMAKAVLDRAGVEYEEVNIDGDPEAAATVLAINGGYTTVPTILLPNGHVLVEPSRRELFESLGIDHLPDAS